MTNETSTTPGSSPSETTTETTVSRREHLSAETIDTPGSLSNEDATGTTDPNLQQNTAQAPHTVAGGNTPEITHVPAEGSLTDIHTAVNKVHKCVRGKGAHPWLEFISQWYLLLLHACYSLAFALVMIYWLDGTKVAISNNSVKTLGFMMDAKLTQPAVTTIVSVCLVIARILSASWQSLAAWRCVFILLEKYELSLYDISRLISFRLPPLSIMRKSPPSLPGRVTLRSIMILVLLLAWPCQFANPIASGSISWIPTDNYTESVVQLPVLPTDTSKISDPWHWFVDYATVRGGMIQRSAGYASMVSPWSTTQDSEQDVTDMISGRRVAPGLPSKNPLTVVVEATVPAFEIDSFQWVTNITTLPAGILDAIMNPLSGSLDVTGNGSPMEGIGAMALLRDSPWEPPSREIITPPHIVADKRYAAIFVSRSPNDGEGYDYDCRRAESWFDPLPDGIALINKAYDNNYSNCIAVAEIQIRAGVTQCHHVPWQDSSCFLSAGIITSENQDKPMLPDSLVSLVLAMMPEVQALVEALSWHDPNGQHGRMEARLRNSLVQAYQATWSELTEWMADTSQTEATIYEPEASLLRARVSPWRMLMWLATNMLLVISGILLLSYQVTCDGKTVNDSVVAAMMTDSSEVIESDSTGLCNAMDVGQGHGKTQLKLRLQVSGSKPVGGVQMTSHPHARQDHVYVHPKLVPSEEYFET